MRAGGAARGGARAAGRLPVSLSLPARSGRPPWKPVSVPQHSGPGPPVGRGCRGARRPAGPAGSASGPRRAPASAAGVLRQVAGRARCGGSCGSRCSSIFLEKKIKLDTCLFCSQRQEKVAPGDRNLPSWLCAVPPTWTRPRRGPQTAWASGVGFPASERSVCSESGFSKTARSMHFYK